MQAFARFFAVLASILAIVGFFTASLSFLQVFVCFLVSTSVFKVDFKVDFGANS